MRTYFLFILVFLYLPASAGIYKWVDEDGKAHYSDQEHNGAEEVKLPEPVTYKPTTPRSVTGGKEDSQKQPDYTELSITQPKLNETIRSNEGDVQVNIILKPKLLPGDRIALYLDGKATLKGLTQTSVKMTSLDRGSHTLKAIVFGKDGETKIASKSIIFHLHQASIKTESNDDSQNNNSGDASSGIPSSSGTFSPGTSFSPNYKPNK